MTETGGQYLGPGARISRYEVREVLGAGGFGITYKAFDTRLHCEVAVKEYLPAEFAVRESNQTTVKPRSDDIAELYQQGIARFLEEARVLAKFKNRHIVRVSDYMEVNGTAYLVMDYEEGESLRELLKKRGGSLSETEIKNLFLPILDGLKAVHDAGLLHRDIKPDNIYLRSEGPPVLLDFGAARHYTANQTRDITAIVTPGYAPFEQYQPNGNLGAWTDLYAIGATLYHCISGKAPLDALSRHGTSIDPLPPAVEAGGDRYSKVLLQTIDWMLQRQADERARSVDEVIPCVQGRAEPPLIHTVMDPLPSSQAAPTVRVSPPGAATGEATIMRPVGGAAEGVPSAPQSGARRMPLIIGAVVAVLIAAGGTWWFMDDQGKKQLALELQQAERVAQSARQEADKKAEEEAARIAKAEIAQQETEAEQKAREEADRMAQAEAEQKAREEAARVAQAEAEQKAQEEADRIAQVAAEQKAREEADRIAQVAAEKKAQEEAALIAQLSGQQEPSGPAANSTAEDASIQAKALPPGGEEAPETITGNVDEFLAALMIESEQTDNGSGAAEPAGQSPGSGKQTLSPAEINKLLGEAEFFLSKSRLVAPDSGNALQIYEKILAVNPENQTAREGMIKIGAVYEKAATNMLQEGRPDISARIARLGLKAVPDHPGLLELQARLQTESQ
jgi:multidrug efflux pump subunit AcrA (membrane-fusion protein)